MKGTDKMTGKERIQRADRIQHIREILGSCLFIGAILLVFLAVAALESGVVDYPGFGIMLIISLVMFGASVPVFGEG